MALDYVPGTHRGFMACSRCKADAQSWVGMTFCCIVAGSDHDFVLVDVIEVEDVDVPRIEACP